MTTLLRRIIFLLLVAVFAAGCASSATTVEPTLSPEQIKALAPLEWKGYSPDKGDWDEAAQTCDPAKPDNEPVLTPDNKIVYFAYKNLGVITIYRNGDTSNEGVELRVADVSNVFADEVSILDVAKKGWPSTKEDCEKYYWTQFVSFQIGDNPPTESYREGSVITIGTGADQVRAIFRAVWDVNARDGAGEWLVVLVVLPSANI